MQKLVHEGRYSIVALDKFIMATRDSGYKGTPNAISEIIDNAIQAEATKISIVIGEANSYYDNSLQVSVLDNGIGMDPETLRLALRFGGTTRFNDRQGFGRYGMGLPNSSLSQARRVTVYSWQSPDSVYSSYLDVDEIAQCELTEIPAPVITKLPFDELPSASGTLVIWSKCDRLDSIRSSTLRRKLAATIGKKFRYCIWNNIKISLNGDDVQAIDPLFVNPNSVFSGATVFGEPLEYEIQLLAGESSGKVKVIFSELPISEWYRFSNEQKRQLGITRGSGVSVVRAGREVDYGWFFMGGKPRENYDDWWRCEVQFEPPLDDSFGITHTKQHVHPKPQLIDLLSPDIETTSRALNGRVRKAHLELKNAERFSEAERVASAKEHLLPPISATPSAKTKAFMEELKHLYPSIKNSLKDQASELNYIIIESTLKDTAFYSYANDSGHLILVLNPAHPFYKEIYAPLSKSDHQRDKQLRSQLELVLLAVARSEAALENELNCELLMRKRLDWSNNLATFLNG